MKNTLSAFIYFLLLSISLPSFAFNQEDQTKKIRVGNFQSLELRSNFDVHVTKSNVYSVTVMGRAEDLENLDVLVDGNTLKFNINTSSWSWLRYNKNHKKIGIQITMPRIKDAEFSGACRVSLHGFTDEEQMNISVNGASKLTAESLQVDKLILDLSGASQVKINGRVSKLNATISGASELMADKLVIRDADIEASGASRAQLNIQKSLQVEASGASKVEYAGTPLNLSKDVSGASIVRRVN